MAFTRFYLAIYMALSSAVIASASVSGYGPNPNVDKPRLEKEKLLSSLVGIQGLIYCKSGPKLIPLEGAIARITCLTTDEYGHEAAPWSILSGATDAKGYFLATLSPSEVEDKMKIKECKAFLETSPSLETCNVPTDINKGITGAPLASYNFLTHKNMKLFTVGPFFYTTNPKPVSNGY
ncbi:protein SEED AND ROOT HAIR PROTECTIVE PROTEIN [Ricinus communis]|uniref:Structural constituent of cell wall, putative n=1 Tax=Ricinus communis TaxID=3988 RepID=B9SAV3_RICCO|nr:protein SEED AND ROOT HAIR PROTECTIVE PROTEIN [Ricinus communis]EEF39307.1 structural constituent of cell wall, putative [Ricinus communis]|eukprot:XP_002523122.1 proline-rich protein 3 [Ricinus communis]